MEALNLLIDIIARAVLWLMIIYVVMSWLLNFGVLNTQNEMVRAVWRGVSNLADRLCAPIRRLLPDLGGLDLAPMAVAVIAIVGATFLRTSVLPALM